MCFPLFLTFVDILPSRALDLRNVQHSAQEPVAAGCSLMKRELRQFSACVTAFLAPWFLCVLWWESNAGLLVYPPPYHSPWLCPTPSARDWHGEAYSQRPLKMPCCGVDSLVSSLISKTGSWSSWEVCFLAPPVAPTQCKLDTLVRPDLVRSPPLLFFLRKILLHLSSWMKSTTKSLAVTQSWDLDFRNPVTVHFLGL